MLEMNVTKELVDDMDCDSQEYMHMFGIGGSQSFELENVHVRAKCDPSPQLRSGPRSMCEMYGNG